MTISLYRFIACIVPLQFTVALALAPPPRVPETRADHILVLKSEHTLTLYAHGKVLRTYRVALGRATGAKQQQGDNRTPEGHYRIVSHNGHSSCHLALHISYPSADDRTHHRTGGDVEIHGLPNGFGYLGALHRSTDWTYGCIAVTDPEMDEIYRLVPDGIPIDIQP